MLTRVLAVCAVVGAAVLVASSPVVAGGGLNGVDCTQRPQPGCNVGAATPGHPASGNPAEQNPSTGGAAQPCRDPHGHVIACERDGAWAGSDGCYYKPATPPPSAIKRAGGQPAGPGAWYSRTCYSSGRNGTYTTDLVWRRSAPATLSPAQAAQQAVARLRLPSPAISTNPAADALNLVGVPVWLWIDHHGWTSRSASAAVPGVRVTATATPARVSWRLGDGTTLVCQGPGTPWTTGTDPAAASPDCGHTYTSASGGQPGGRYTITATLSWVVSWAGAGQSGTLPALSTSDSVRMRVGESQAVNITG